MNNFEKIIISAYGELGKLWLKGLPELTESIAVSWGLSDLTPVANLSYNFVLSGLYGQRPIILKIAFDENALQREERALRAFQGFGAVEIIKQRPDALLLERAVPGYSLKEFFPHKEHEAIHISGDLMKALHKAPFNDEDFPTMRDWLSVLKKNWPIPDRYMHKARIMSDQLINSSMPQVLLHGDLHHDNIIRDSDRWVVIDPKGVIGHPVNELWAFMNNPTANLSKEIIDNRIANFAHIMAVDPDLIARWCFVQSVLSWVWDIEDNLPTATIELTDIFDKLS